MIWALPLFCVRFPEALRPLWERRGFVPPHILHQICHFGVKLLSALSKGFCSCRNEH